jgi:hypothetical protein
MSTLTLTVQDIQILQQAKQKLYNQKRLSGDERSALTTFLDSLPPTEDLLNEKFPVASALKSAYSILKKCGHI